VIFSSHEVAGQVHSDHHRPVDPLGVAPGVDQRRPRAGALAHEVDAVIAERDARRLQVVDLLREPVAGEVDALVGQSACAGPEGVVVRAEGALVEEVGRVRERRIDLRADEPDGAVDPPVADEDDIVILSRRGAGSGFVTTDAVGLPPRPRWRLPGRRREAKVPTLVDGGAPLRGGVGVR
jgi:hypothetical protein